MNTVRQSSYETTSGTCDYLATVSVSRGGGGWGSNRSSPSSGRHLPNNRRARKMTRSETPTSAALAAQNEALPKKVRIAKTTSTAIESVTFYRMILKVRCKCPVSQANIPSSSDISTMSAASMAESLPTAPMTILRDARPWQAYH